MYFKTCKESIESNLNMVARIVPTRSTAPILENIVICVTKGNVFLSANNAEIYMKTKIIAMPLEEGEVAVNGKLFAELIRKLPDNQEISIKKEVELNITAGKTKVSLPYMDAKIYPEPPKTKKNNSITFTVDGQTFRKALHNTIYAAKKMGDNLKLSSMNLVINENKDRLYLCSLDGHRVAKNYVPFSRKQTDSNKECNIIIPLYTCQEILKTRFQEMEFMVSENHITICSGDFLIISSLIAGNYFDISNIGTNSTISIQVQRQTLEDSINRSLVLLNDQTPLRIHIKQDEMNLSYYSSSGKLTESLNIDGAENKSSLEIGFNPIFLLDAVKAVGDDVIKLDFINSTSPCIIQNECSMHIILPVALKAA